MKNYIYILLLLLPFGAIAQNYSVAQPRMRVNRTADFVLTTTFQTLVLNGTSVYNNNTYGIDATTGNRVIRYDSATDLFKFIGEYDKNIQLQLFIKTTTPVVTTAASMQYRIVIPNGISAGVDLNFPFPDDGGYGDLTELTKFTFATQNITTPLNIYINSAIRINGFKIQVRLSNSLATLGTSTINSAAVLIQSNN